VCKTPYTTPLPERSRLLGLVRAGGDELARLLQPGPSVRVSDFAC
jgi:hypothetical protein